MKLLRKVTNNGRNRTWEPHDVCCLITRTFVLIADTVSPKTEWQLAWPNTTDDPCSPEGVIFSVNWTELMPWLLLGKDKCTDQPIAFTVFRVLLLLSYLLLPVSICLPDSHYLLRSNGILLNHTIMTHVLDDRCTEQFDLTPFDLPVAKWPPGKVFSRVSYHLSWEK